MKICKLCLLELPLDAFTVSKVTKDGREGKCRTCRAEQRKKYTKNCEHCSAEFTTPKKETVYCSLQCAGKAKIKSVELECPACTRTFEVNPYRAKAGRVFCSKECYTKDLSQSMKGEKNWNYSRVSTKCFKCEKEISIHPSKQAKHKYHFCSKECYLTGIGATRTGELNSNYKRVECTCVECDKKFERKPSQIRGETFCSNGCRVKWLSSHNTTKRFKRRVVKCFNCEKELSRLPSRLSKSEAHYCSLNCKDVHYAKTFRSGENAYNYNPNKTLKDRIRERSYPEYRNWRVSVYSRDNYTCVSCKDAKGGNLIAHHIFSYAKNPTLRTDIDNGVTLCTKCHSDFHSRFGYYNNTEDQFNTFLKSKIS